MSTNLKFITGLSGEAHVKPSMDAQWHSAENGKETFVYDYGKKFQLSVNQAMSTMSIADGLGQIQGRLFIIEESLIETISYPNVPPEVGLTRIDTIVLHWGTSTRIINGETVTINTCEFEYKKNPLANGQPESFAEGDLNLGDTDAYYPMWHVVWTENGIQEVDAIFSVISKSDFAIDTSAPSGTVDGDLYSSILNNNWVGSVIDGDVLNQKKLDTLILNNYERRELLWTNPSGANSKVATFGEGDITLNKPILNHAYIICEFRCVYNEGTRTFDTDFLGVAGMSARVFTFGTSGNPLIAYSRYWYPNGTDKVWFSHCARISSNASPVYGQDTGCLVPLRIWGIK